MTLRSSPEHSSATSTDLTTARLADNGIKQQPLRYFYRAIVRGCLPATEDAVEPGRPLYSVTVLYAPPLRWPVQQSCWLLFDLFRMDNTVTLVCWSIA